MNNVDLQLPINTNRPAKIRLSRMALNCTPGLIKKVSNWPLNLLTVIKIETEHTLEDIQLCLQP